MSFLKQKPRCQSGDGVAMATVRESTASVQYRNRMEQVGEL